MQTSKNEDNIILTIIIVSYERTKDLDECIQSIYKYNDLKQNLEIIVVDHSPSESLYNFIERTYRNKQNFKIIKHENKGFGSGNNYGASFAKGKYLLFLNPDTVLIEPIFLSVINSFYEDTGMIGVKLLNNQLHANKSFDWVDKFGFFTNQYMKYCNIKNIFDEKNMYTEGADIFIKKDVFAKVKQFDEKLFMYFEEPDLVHRLHEFGYKNMFIKECHIIHKEGRSFGESEFTIREKIKSQIYYSHKYKIDYKRKLRYEKILFRILSLISKSQRKSCLLHIGLLNEYLEK